MTKPLIDLLAAELSYLRIRLDEVEKKNAELEKENYLLKEKLGLNSKNSSLPPSTDKYSKKEKKEPTGQRPGGQPGHKANLRKLLEADKVVECKPFTTCKCGGSLQINDEFLIHQKIELPVIKPIVTNYHIYSGFCNKCLGKCSGSLPSNESYDLLGNNAKSTIAILTGVFKHSKRDVVKLFKYLLNLEISLGTVSNTERRVSKKCEIPYNQLAEKTEESKKLHIDETSHYFKDQNKWAWVFTNNEITLFKLGRSRGMKTLEEILPEYSGIVISDRYAAYNYFDSSNRQICWAHLMRDFERMANSWSSELSKIGKEIKELCGEVFILLKKLRNNEIKHHIFLKRCNSLRKKIQALLKLPLDLPEVSHAKKVCNNIMKSESMMWKFLEDPLNIDITNNLAERQIRPYVIYRKMSFFTWSHEGERFLERIMSLTMSNPNQNPFNLINGILAAN